MVPSGNWRRPSLFVLLRSKCYFWAYMQLLQRFRALPSLTRRRWVWLFLGIAALGIRIPFGIWPGLTEQVYARGWFAGFRWVWDFSIGAIPIPLVYVLLVVLLGVIGVKIVKRIRGGRGKGSFWTRLLRFLHGVSAWMGGALFFFLVLWGYNYQRLPVEKQMGLDPKPLNSDQIRVAADRGAKWLTEARSVLSEDTAALSREVFPADLNMAMRGELTRVLKAEGYNPAGKVRIKRIWPGGAMMRLGIAGIYLPFVGQGYVPADMPAVDLPYTMAHEMSHAIGFGDEGTCNFLAFLACETSDDPALVYSGRINYWSYIARDLYRLDPEAYDTLKASLPAGVKADLRVLRNYSRKYRSFMTLVGYRVNNAYLKTQGVQEGIESYNRLVVLVEAWMFREGK